MHSKRSLRESREKVAELEQQLQSEGHMKSNPDASSSDLTNRTFRHRLQDAEENRQMTEAMAQQAQAQIHIWRI
jgi:cell division septum initiation protein DivIVA